MSSSELLNEVRRWFRFAREDLDAAETLLTETGFLPRHVCWLSQQAAGKALKGALASQQISFPFRHDLDALRNFLPDDWQVKARHADLAELTEWAVEARYPGDWPEATTEDARRAAAQARGVFESVRAGSHRARDPARRIAWEHSRGDIDLTTWELLESKRNEILRITERHGARDVRVFGSAVRGDVTDESDIDFLASTGGHTPRPQVAPHRLRASSTARGDAVVNPERAALAQHRLERARTTASRAVLVIGPMLPRLVALHAPLHRAR